MQSTVADVLEIPAVRSADPIVLGGGDLLARPVRWLHTTDGTDLSGLLKGGEMILTAGESFTGTIWDAMAYFENLVENGASGVMVSLLSDRVEAKSVLREAARTATLPVILLRDRVAFVELTEAVHRVLLASDQDEAPSSAPIRLIDQLSVESASPAEVLRRAAELLLAPVVYEDTKHRVVAYATGGIPRDRLLADWATRSRGAAGGASEPTAEWQRVDYREGEQPLGRLVVPMPLTDPLATAILERAAQVLEHCYANLAVAPDARFRAMTGAFEELRDNAPPSEASALLRAEAGGIAPAELYVPVVLLRAETPTDAAARAETDADGMLAAAYGAAREAGTPLACAVLSATAVGGVIGVSGGSDRGDSLERLASELDALTNGALSGGTWVMAVGRGGESLVDAVTGGVDEAHSVAEAASGRSIPSALYVTAGDVRLRRLLRSMSGEPLLREFAEESLADLKAEAPECLGILRTYIELNGNVAEVARAVFLSRPSVYARLNRIEEIVGASLSSVDTRMGLYVALLADDYAESEARSTP